MQMRMSERSFGTGDVSREGHLSVAERELLVFVETASELVGPEARGRLREIWLDELACMDCMPEPSSPKWRLVTEAALRRLALLPVGSHSKQPLPWDPKDGKRSQ